MDIRDLIEHSERVATETTIEDVATHFLAHSSEFMAVCDGPRVVGVCSRGQMNALLSGRYGFALHSRSPIGRQLLDDPLLFPADGGLEELLGAALSRTGEAFLHDAVIVDADGSLAGLVSMRRLVAAQGTLVEDQFVRLASQRLELKRTNEELSRSLAQQQVLEKQVIQKEKAALVQTLVAGIAHELNNKLMPVLGYAELLIEEVTAGDHSRVVGYSRTLRDAAAEGAGIVQQILQLSRPVMAERQRVDLREIVEQSLTLVALRVRESGVTPDLIMPAHPVTILGDPSQLKQVVVNLTLNALDAMEGVTPARLEVTVRESDGMAAIAVRDMGTGIAPEHLSRIFDPFFTTKGPTRGTGLGLGVCAAIARQHEGSIEVDSAAGQGSTFTVSLPLAAERRAPVGRAARPELRIVPGEAGRSVLVVDDDDMVLRVVADTLRSRLGIAADRATDAEQAQRALLARQHDFILCDVRMPVVSGLQLLEWMRTHCPGQVKNFALMTGEMGHTALDHEIVLADVPVLRKPFTADALLRLARLVLDEGRAA